MVLGGANDIYSNDANGFIRKFFTLLQTLYFINVVVVTIPLRYDLPVWSCVNKEIQKTNRKVMNFCQRYHNFNIVDISDLERDKFTGHGLHMNRRGKIELANRINKIFKNNKQCNKPEELSYTERLEN